MEKQKLKRRKFIQGMATLTIASTIMPRSLMGMSTVSPSERINLGVIGIGKRGSGLLRSFLEIPETQIVAVSDVDSEKLNRGKEIVESFYSEKTGQISYSGCDTYKDFRELIHRKDIDAVVIATPDHWHALMTILAVKTGKDVYCEKPLALTIGEGQKMLEAVRKYNRVFQTGSQQRSSFEFRFASELVQNHYIGELQKVDVYLPPGGVTHPNYCTLPGESVPDILDWEMWLGPAPDRPYNPILAPPITEQGWPRWREYIDYSGGIMTDWGAHHFDIVQWALGMDGSGPVEIIPPDENKHRPLTFIYDNGLPVTMKLDNNVHNRIDFYGAKGKIEVSRGWMQTTPETLMKQIIKPDDIRLYKSLHHQQNWIDCIRSRKKPICDVAIGHRSVSLSHLGNLVVQLYRPLKWNPVKEQFVNDTEANTMLSRPMRSPWVI